MNTQPVVAAVDGSDDSLHALEWVLDAARRRGAPLRIVHVRQYAPWAQPEVLAAGPPDPDEDPVLDQVRSHLARRSGLPAAEYVALEGAPGALLPEAGPRPGCWCSAPGAAGASPACCSGPTPWPRHVTPSARSSSCPGPGAGAGTRKGCRPGPAGPWWSG